MILDEEKIKQEDLNNNEEDDDQNFIDKQEQNEFSSKEAREEVLQGLKNAVKDVSDKLKDVGELFTKKKRLRDLDRETGGTEVDYKEVDKKNDMDKDVWDKEMGESSTQDQEIAFEGSQNESFIHDIKTRGGIGGKRRRRRKLGTMMLGDVKIGDVKDGEKLSFGEAVNQFRSNNRDTGRGM